MAAYYPKLLATIAFVLVGHTVEEFDEKSKKIVDILIKEKICQWTYIPRLHVEVLAMRETLITRLGD